MKKIPTLEELSVQIEQEDAAPKESAHPLDEHFAYLYSFIEMSKDVPISLRAIAKYYPAAPLLRDLIIALPTLRDFLANMEHALDATCAGQIEPTRPQTWFEMHGLKSDR